MSDCLLPFKELNQIAWALLELHGQQALTVADNCIKESEDEGFIGAADAWRSVKTLMIDASNGHIARGNTHLH